MVVKYIWDVFFPFDENPNAPKSQKLTNNNVTFNVNAVFPLTSIVLFYP